MNTIPREVIVIVLQVVGILAGGLGIGFVLFLVPVLFGEGIGDAFNDLLSKLT